MIKNESLLNLQVKTTMTPSLYSQNILETMQDVFNFCPTIMHHELLNHIELYNVSKDTVFIHEGDECNGIYVVVDGSMKLYIKRENKNHIFLFKTANDIIGIEPAINKSVFSYDVSAMEDSRLAFIPADRLENILARYPNALTSLMKKINQKASDIESRSSLMFTDSAEKVVISILTDMKSRFGTDANGYIKINIPVKDLAGYMCMSKTNLYRILQTLKEKTILTHHLNKYRLENIS